MLSLANEVRSLAQRIAHLELNMKTASASKPLNMFAIRNGSIPEFDSTGKLVGRIGLQPDGSHIYASLDGPTPPKPSVPTFYGVGPHAFAVYWDGLTEAGVAPPLDTEALQVWVCYADADFTPPIPESSWVLQGEIGPKGGCLLGDTTSPGRYNFIRCRLRSASGKTGAWSEPTSGTGIASPTFPMTCVRKAFGNAIAGKTASAGSTRSLFSVTGHLTADSSDLLHLTLAGTVDTTAAGQVGLAVRYATGAVGSKPSATTSSPLLHTEMISVPSATTGARIAMSVHTCILYSGYGPKDVSLLVQLVTVGTAATTRSVSETTDWAISLTGGGYGSYVDDTTWAVL